MQQNSHPFARVGHLFVLGLLGLHMALSHFHAIAPEVSGSLQIAIAALGGSYGAAIIHSALVQRALIMVGKVPQVAGQVAQVAQDVAQAAGDVSAIGKKASS